MASPGIRITYVCSGNVLIEISCIDAENSVVPWGQVGGGMQAGVGVGAPGEESWNRAQLGVFVGAYGHDDL